MVFSIVSKLRKRFRGYDGRYARGSSPTVYKLYNQTITVEILRLLIKWAIDRAKICYFECLQKNTSSTSEHWKFYFLVINGNWNCSFKVELHSESSTRYVNQLVRVNILRVFIYDNSHLLHLSKEAPDGIHMGLTYFISDFTAYVWMNWQEYTTGANIRAEACIIQVVEQVHKYILYCKMHNFAYVR